MQRSYRASERLRPGSRHEVALTRDLPASGDDGKLGRVCDVDLNNFIKVGPFVGAATCQGLKAEARHP